MRHYSTLSVLVLASNLMKKMYLPVRKKKKLEKYFFIKWVKMSNSKNVESKLFCDQRKKVQLKCCPSIFLNSRLLHNLAPGKL